MLCCVTLYAETIHVPNPGDLKEALMDADFQNTQLKITGTLNGADLKAIHDADGRLAKVTDLDLSETTFTSSDDCYATYKTDAGSGWGLEYTSFYYSETCKIDTTHSTTMTGIGVYSISVYSNNLAGLFIGNTTYQKVSLPKTMNKIGLGIFMDSSVKTATLPSAYTEIEPRAFQSSSIPEIVLPSTCKTIGYKAFYQSIISNINMENVTKLGARTFAYSNIKGNVKLGKLKEVPVGCFSNCHITSIELQEGLEYIGGEAFYLPSSEQINFVSVTVPKSIQYVGANAFPENSYGSFEAYDGVYYIGRAAYAFRLDAANKTALKFKDGTIGISSNLAYSNSKPSTSLVSLEFPSSVRIIGDGVFENYTKLETVNLPEDLDELGIEAFKGCKALKNITIPKSLQAIELGTFEGCESLKEIALPENLHRIGSYAFKGSGITTFTIGENVEEIGSDVLADCKSLLSLRVDAKTMTYHTWLECPVVEKITFGPKVSYIGYNFMAGQTSLIKVIFEEDENDTTTLVIENNAFTGSSNLKIASLPRRLTSVGSSAFNGIKEISSLRLEYGKPEYAKNAFDNIEHIGELYYDASSTLGYDFSSKTRIDKIVVGTHVAEVRNVFKNNDNLTSVIFESRKGIDDVRGLKIERGTFDNCNISNVVFPEYNDDVAEDVKMEIRGFNNNPITELKMPDNVETRIYGAFNNCQIENVYLGNNTKSISEDPFGYEGSFAGNKLKWVDIPPSVYWVGVHSFDAEYLIAHNSENNYFSPTKSDEKYTMNILCPINFVKHNMESYVDTTVARIVGYSVDIQEHSLTLKVGEKLQLHPVFTTDAEMVDLPELKYTWKAESADSAITVDENGVVTALKATNKYSGVRVGISYEPNIYCSSIGILVDEPTNIDNVYANSVRVDVCNGYVVISGANDNSIVDVYTLGGQCVRTTFDKLIRGLASGIYVVAVDGQKYKIMIP